jgi:hypothetical protein
MQTLDLDYTFRYHSSSALVEDAGRNRLALVTMPDRHGATRFFDGAVAAPKRTADLLLTVVDVVESRFHIPPAMLARILKASDPVITCGREMMRFEGFSACCGVYVRLDLLPYALDGERLQSGTTNVNINPPMRVALSRLRDGEPMALSVGSEGLEVRSSGASQLENRVTLPARWLRGFAEVQALQARMTPRFSLSGAEFRRFLREVPDGLKGPVWVSAGNGTVRLTTVPNPDTVAVGGISRLRVLSHAARHVTRANVYAPDDASAFAWELETPDSRLILVLSADIWRGFSGEGQVLEMLAGQAGDSVLGTVRAMLHWQETIDPDEIAAEAGTDRASVDRALAQCAISGIVGYDLSRGSYFHRELPYDVAHVTKLQPRLENAGRLVRDDAITIDDSSDSITAWVRSGDLEYRVMIHGNDERCTCVWFAKHAAKRGPCKHILAVRMSLSGDSQSGDDDVR